MKPALQTIQGTDGAELRFGVENGKLEVTFTLPKETEAGTEIDAADLAVFVAIGTDGLSGSAVVPYGRNKQGSTVFLPFRAERIYRLANRPGGGSIKEEQRWERARWQEPQPADFDARFSAQSSSPSPSPASFRLAVPVPKEASRFKLAVYVKAMAANEGWGRMIASSGSSVLPLAHAQDGFGDQFLAGYWEWKADAFAYRPRHGEERARIYQLFIRLFGNLRSTGKRNGTLAENGCGKFGDINTEALQSLRAMGFTHLWLTGVLRQATATDYCAIGLPADDPDLLKGIAGSPYALKDAFDVCPDYAQDPARRLEEFKALLERIHAAGMRAIIDLTPNHVARSYHSLAMPECDFGTSSREGRGDDRSRFFDPQNHFFYLPTGPGLDGSNGPPLVLPTLDKEGRPATPTCETLGTCDGRYPGELEWGRVTGNNVASWAPGRNDWYETIKLNFGFDFTTGQSAYPNARAPETAIPDTWHKMDRVIAYWQQQGVDGFRCDMAHLIPPEFWGWAIPRARRRDPEAFFIAEAYDNDSAKVPSRDPVLAGLYDGRGHTAINLLDAGFDAVYGHPAYRTLKALYDSSAWANDLDGAIHEPFLAPNSVCYAENHDEVRLAARGKWGGIGMDVGRPVSAILYGLSRGPILLYNGQEVGEPADNGTVAHAAGFGGDHGRTSLFDYGSMPELAKWVNGHAYDGANLSPDQKALRAFYGRLLRLMNEPAFRDGDFYGLNFANNQSRHFGRLPGEAASGHWMYAFLRYDRASGQRFLVVVNLHRDQAFRDVQIVIPKPALLDLGLAPETPVTLTDRLAPSLALALQLVTTAREIILPVIPPLTPYFFEIKAP